MLVDVHFYRVERHKARANRPHHNVAVPLCFLGVESLTGSIETVLETTHSAPDCKHAHAPCHDGPSEATRSSLQRIAQTLNSNVNSKQEPLMPFCAHRLRMRMMGEPQLFEQAPWLTSTHTRCCCWTRWPPMDQPASLQPQRTPTERKKNHITLLPSQPDHASRARRGLPPH